MSYIISGIQQVGIGVANVHEGFKWYNKHFGMDVPIFEEAAEANLMLPYTGGKPHKRHAILAINLKGGGGFEIWQYTSRTPQAATFKPQLGDLGLFCAKMKTDNVQASYDYLTSQNVKLLGNISTSPAGKKHFFLEDAFGNLFEVVEDDAWFGKGFKNTGGPVGMMIGVSNLEKSIEFYSKVLGYDKVLFKGENSFDDLAVLPGGAVTCKRAILTHTNERQGPFSKLFGKGYIELVEAKNYTPRKIFENRLWGDLGFIHLCFDIKNMAGLKKACEAAGHPFTVDGGAGFEMGEAAGHFTYIEDPDGTLIEFVETKKIPIMKKWGWYLDLKKRAPEKRLPDWMLKALKFNRKKV
ncbi:MAG: Glyoxalase/bleomycin resistance protein/dioxygenase [Bacteroidetes bacterium]|jgi:catechol 2,3-dioxygenase-like lactoylglutathione lyase family enzyme|nr:Glyoxalase/bleomycin resistance protein/dioxygenase [Bacteroidota bacterium]